MGNILFGLLYQNSLLNKIFKLAMRFVLIVCGEFLNVPRVYLSVSGIFDLMSSQ